MGSNSVPSQPEWIQKAPESPRNQGGARGKGRTEMVGAVRLRPRGERLRNIRDMPEVG